MKLQSILDRNTRFFKSASYFLVFKMRQMRARSENYRKMSFFWLKSSNFRPKIPVFPSKITYRLPLNPKRMRPHCINQRRFSDIRNSHNHRLILCFNGSIESWRILQRVQHRRLHIVQRPLNEWVAYGFSTILSPKPSKNSPGKSFLAIGEQHFLYTSIIVVILDSFPKNYGILKWN